MASNIVLKGYSDDINNFLDNNKLEKYVSVSEKDFNNKEEVYLPNIEEVNKRIGKIKGIKKIEIRYE